MGARQLRDQLNLQGIQVGRKRVKSLMTKMGIEAVYCKPNTSKKTPGHQVYPYLLRGMTINRANQVWALDTTYIPLAKGFAYLTAVVDWATRKVLGYFEWYIHERPHSSLKRKTPHQAYHDGLPTLTLAA